MSEKKNLILVEQAKIEAVPKIEHAVLNGTRDELKAHFENIISGFDTNWLEPKRYK